MAELPFLVGSVALFSKTRWPHDLIPHSAVYLEMRDYSHEMTLAGPRKSKSSPSMLDAEKLCHFPEAL